MIRASMLLFVLALSASCSKHHRHSEADVDFLASDAHVIVGETALVVPFIALTDYVSQKPSFSLNRRGERLSARRRLDDFRAVASTARTAPVLDKVEIRIRTYGWDDSDSSMRRICARLIRSWSRSLCDNPWAPLRQAMPENAFDLADTRRFAAFDHYGTVGGENQGDQLRAMRLAAGRVSVVCDRTVRTETRFCTAALLVAPRLAAIWTVWDGRDETAIRQAEREGRAIALFVRAALGPTEDFPALFAVACGLRRPGHKDGPSGDLCRGPPHI
jgi:hypothetical protein